MKNIIATLCIFISSFCHASSDSTDLAPMSEEEQKRGAYNMNQHLGAGILLAMYFCDYKAWPKSINTLQAYGDKQNFPMPDPMNWSRFSLPGSEVNFGVDVFLKTPSGEKPGDIAVSSKHSPPECTKEFQPKIDVHLGG